MIIGAGVTGTACARELSRYQAKICVLEKEEDLCCGTSKANSAIVHAGYDAREGSLKAKLNVRGNEMMEKLAQELDFPFKRNGSLVICLHEKDFPRLKELYDRGIKNGVRDLRILDGEQVKESRTEYFRSGIRGSVCTYGRNCMSFWYEYCLWRKCGGQWSGILF